MKPTTRTTVSLLLGLALITLATKSVATAPPVQRPLPNPVLYMTTAEPFQKDGKEYLRYRFEVLNKDAYPTELFEAAPGLPPCGTNTKSSRTWVDLFNQSGKRLYGFCALKSAADLNQIWFAMESSEVPPSWVYIELNDRQTNTKYKSNLAETTQ